MLDISVTELIARTMMTIGDLFVLFGVLFSIIALGLAFTQQRPSFNRFFLRGLFSFIVSLVGLVAKLNISDLRDLELGFIVPMSNLTAGFLMGTSAILLIIALVIRKMLARD